MALPVYLETSVIASSWSYTIGLLNYMIFCDLFTMQRKASLLAERSIRVQEYLLKKTMHLLPPFKMNLEIL